MGEGRTTTKRIRKVVLRGKRSQSRKFRSAAVIREHVEGGVALSLCSHCNAGAIVSRSVILTLRSSHLRSGFCGGYVRIIILLCGTPTIARGYLLNHLPLFVKLGMVVHHHTPEYHAKGCIPIVKVKVTMRAQILKNICFFHSS